MMIDLDKDTMVDLINQAIRLHGGDTKRECIYRNGDAPWCIAGVALVLAGATLENLDELDNEPIDVAVRKGYTDSFVTFTPTALHVIERVQAYQDGGLTWSDAMDRALPNGD